MNEQIILKALLTYQALLVEQLNSDRETTRDHIKQSLTKEVAEVGKEIELFQTERAKDGKRPREQFMQELKQQLEIIFDGLVIFRKGLCDLASLYDSINNNRAKESIMEISRNLDIAISNIEKALKS